MKQVACPRCDRFHERWCELCDFEPACHDHNCWSTVHLEEDQTNEL